jgi:putative peptidoglycan lipid II flippase
MEDSPERRAAPREGVGFERTRGAAFLVALGILLSRLTGLIRQVMLARYLGTSMAADAFNAAFRIPNLLQNLFGEGVLSASFIPEYAGLLGAGSIEEATLLASAVVGMLALITSLIVLVGVLGAPYLVAVIANGFTGEKRELTIKLTRILFPGAGLLVFSAWCLGVLNSHRKFFMSYAAPVLWNVAMVAALIGFHNGHSQVQLAVILAIASVVGSAMQVAVQLPLVISLARGVRPRLNATAASVRNVFRNFIPAFVGRGVVQLSAYVDAWLASYLGNGAVSSFTYAQTIYVLPVSLFGMAVSAAELPAMSRAVGTDEEIASYLRSRLNSGLERIAFFIVPSAVALFALGDLIGYLLLQSGVWHKSDTIWVWEILGGSAIGLLASTMGRLYSSTFYALRDTRTPLRFAVIRVALTTVLGYFCALVLPGLLGIDHRWGAAGLTASAGVAGWVEFVLLRHYLGKRIGPTGLSKKLAARLWAAALLAAAIPWGYKVLGYAVAPKTISFALLAVYGLAYLLLTAEQGIPEANAMLGRVDRMMRRKGG